MPRISLVVLTYNRADSVCRTLSKLRETCPEIPIIAVDNHSTDDTVARIRHHFPTVEVVTASINTGAAGRNIGVARVTTEYVAFCDDDTWWEHGALQAAVPLLDRYPQVAVLSAEVVVEDAARGQAGDADGTGTDTGTSVDPTCTVMARSPLDATGLPGPALIGYMAGAAVFRTRAYREVGGYCAKLFIGGEEELVALDLLARGWQLAYAPMLTLRHAPSPLRDARRRRQLLARNALWVACMRLPPTAIGRRTWAALATWYQHGCAIDDGWDMLRGLVWAIRHRRVVSPRVWTLLETVRLDDLHRARQSFAGQTVDTTPIARPRIDDTSAVDGYNVGGKQS